MKFRFNDEITYDIVLKDSPQYYIDEKAYYEENPKDLHGDMIGWGYSDEDTKDKNKIDEFYWELAADDERVHWLEVKENLKKKPCKISGDYADWRGTHRLDEKANMRPDLSEVIKNLVYPNYDHTYTLYRDSTGNHYKFTEATHDAPMGGTVLYIDVLEGDELEKYYNED